MFNAQTLRRDRLAIRSTTADRGIADRSLTRLLPTGVLPAGLLLMVFACGVLSLRIPTANAYQSDEPKTATAGTEPVTVTPATGDAAPAATGTAHSKAEFTAAKESLGVFNSLIGGWRGVGQEKRNSSRGSWQETADWVWDLSGDAPAVVVKIKNGKRFKIVRITADSVPNKFQLELTNVDDSKTTLTGEFVATENKLTANSTTDAAGLEYQITVTLLNEKRTLLAYSQRKAGQSQFAQLAQVGYTREGTRLAEETQQGPECVVTGGLGTIPVTHKGQTYYVCCTGCRDAFDADPDGILADFAERLAERKAKREKEKSSGSNEKK